MRKLLFLFISSLAIFALSISVSAQSKVVVKFKAGETSVTRKDQVAGYKYIDYIIRAKSGQTMDVKLKADNETCGFHIYYSDMKEVDDASGVKESSRNVDVDDDYVVRVILPRSAARRKETARFTLDVSIR